MELKQYMSSIRKRIWLVLAIIIVITVGTGILSSMKQPLYRASATLIVNQGMIVDGTNTINPASIQTNIMLINSYKEIIRSNAIMKQVISEFPNVKASAAELINNVQVSAAEDSQVVHLIYTDVSYSQAVHKVNAISEVFKKQIPQIMKVDNVTILNEANEDPNVSPYNINSISNVVLGFIVSVVLAIGLSFFLDYLDSTYKSDDEVESDLGLPVLASIMKIKDSERARINRNQKIGEGAYVTLN